jgi:N-acetylglucosaminyldiphosphoundecaprenol N-acetyl-beta-D-mannosaminyltransferase
MRDRRLYPVLRLWVDAVDPAETVKTIGTWIDARVREYVCFANVHGAVEAWKDPSLVGASRGAGLVVPDGMPLVWLGRLRGYGQVRRVYGPDLTLALTEAFAARGLRLYLYGGEPGVAEALARTLADRFPGLIVAGAEGPPFRPLTPAEDAAAVARINAASAHAVLIGLGCPKQERWMAEHRQALNAPVLLGVGAAFDFLTARVRQAPRWMMALGLEWLFRLLQEPRRLGRRYLVYNPVFVFHATLQLLGWRHYPSEPPA